MSTQQEMVLPIGMVTLTDAELQETNGGAIPAALLYLLACAGVAVVTAIIGGVVYAFTH